MQNPIHAYAVLCSTLALLMGAGSVAAQVWPTKPVRLMVPYAPGGIADTMARFTAPMLQSALGQTVLVESKPGASGSLGTEYVAKSAPDGQALLIGLAAPQTLNQFIFKVGYDGLRDFAPITLLNTNPLVLMVHPSLPVRNVKELIALAKAQPGKLRFAGAGGLTQFGGEIFKFMAGIDMVHVPYRGGAPAVAATVAGEAQLTFANYSDAVGYMQSGRLRELAITSARRFPQAPELMTIAEAGLQGYEVEGWTGLLASAGTSREIIAKLAAIVQQGP
ncbi:MAG: tripartite tricarboxylate transporter substrate binding protein [Betaproteobacteria bacterium]|nr:tripartite tricarboxylate transporter substrate binding protein [Betaproteobacteria bacterium]